MAIFLTGCAENAETVRDDVKEDVEGVVQMAGYAIKMLQLSTESCEDIIQMSVREGEGYGVPGASGAERWGIPDSAPAVPRVRRSWSTLSDAEKKQVVDGFVKLKQTTVDSQATGAERADYETFCEGTYTRNLHDFYVELAFEVGCGAVVVEHVVVGGVIDGVLPVLLNDGPDRRGAHLLRGRAVVGSRLTRPGTSCAISRDSRPS